MEGEKNERKRKTMKEVMTERRNQQQSKAR